MTRGSEIEHNKSLYVNIDNHIQEISSGTNIWRTKSLDDTYPSAQSACDPTITLLEGNDATRFLHSSFDAALLGSNTRKAKSFDEGILSEQSRKVVQVDQIEKEYQMDSMDDISKSLFANRSDIMGQAALALIEKKKKAPLVLCRDLDLFGGLLRDWLWQNSCN